MLSRWAYIIYKLSIIGNLKKLFFYTFMLQIVINLRYTVTYSICSTVVESTKGVPQFYKFDAIINKRY